MRSRIPVACLGLMCVTLAACGMNEASTVQSLQKRLAEIAGQANGAAPAEIDPDTRLDGARAGPGLKLTTNYTLVNAEADGVDGTKFEKNLVPTIEKGACENPDLRPLIDQGVLVVLEYRGKQGNLIGAVNIKRATCAALK